jgi:hypothetical protein
MSERNKTEDKDRRGMYRRTHDEDVENKVLTNRDTA